MFDDDFYYYDWYADPAYYFDEPDPITFGDPTMIIPVYQGDDVIGKNLDDGSWNWWNSLEGNENFMNSNTNDIGGGSFDVDDGGGFFDSIGNALGDAFNNVFGNAINQGTQNLNQQISKKLGPANPANSPANGTAAQPNISPAMMLGGVVVIGLILYLAVKKS